MKRRWMATTATCAALIMDEYFYQFPAAVSGQLRNSTVCNNGQITAVQSKNSCELVANPFHVDALDYNLLYGVSAVGTALGAPFHQFLLRRFGTAVMGFIAYALSLFAV